MRLIDSHCHLDFECFDQDRDEVLQQARSAGVCHLVIPGVRAATWSRLLELCRRHSGLFPALGLHPYFIEEHSPEQLEVLRQMLRAESDILLAVGEIGVDARKPSLEVQWELFRAQLDLAQEFSKPVIIHSVKTHDEVCAELRRRRIGKGVIHAFSGSRQQAENFVDSGLWLGIGGVITHQRARKTREAIRHIPLDKLVLESDAPDMAMAGRPGLRNSPQWLPEVLDSLAELREESPQALARQLWRNACDLFECEFPQPALDEKAAAGSLV